MITDKYIKCYVYYDFITTSRKSYINWLLQMSTGGWNTGKIVSSIDGDGVII